jgi:GH43 family beta-xylosidase
MSLHYTNPVYPYYFADPFVFRHEGTHFAVGTGVLEARSEAEHGGTLLTVDGRPGVFTLLQSNDLTAWTPVGAAMAALDPEFGDAYWAPEIAYAGGRFWLYYSVGRGDKAHHIRVAVSDRPQGPYEDTGARLTDPFVCPFAIDASPFQDDDGQWYLFSARDFLDADGIYRAGTGLAVDRLVNMTALAGDERVVMRARHDWQRFVSNRVMYGSRYDWHTLEGPCVCKRNGRYYCLFSAGRWENETYGVDYAVADHVLGPYSDRGNESGARILRTRPGKIIGPGHNCVISGPDGQADYIVYHAWDAAMTARRMFLDRIEWTPAGPRSPGPSFEPQTMP